MVSKTTTTTTTTTSDDAMSGLLRAPPPPCPLTCPHTCPLTCPHAPAHDTPGPDEDVADSSCLGSRLDSQQLNSGLYLLRARCCSEPAPPRAGEAVSSRRHHDLRAPHGGEKGVGAAGLTRGTTVPVLQQLDSGLYLLAASAPARGAASAPARGAASAPARGAASAPARGSSARRS